MKRASSTQLVSMAIHDLGLMMLAAVTGQSSWLRMVMHFRALDGEPCPAGDRCALNRGAVFCRRCERRWPPDTSWEQVP